MKQSQEHDASEASKNLKDAIAIVGIDGRFPGAGDVEAFWSNLCQGKESITFFTPEELRAAGVPEEDIANPSYVPAGGAIEGYDRFDAGFFGYSAMEAAVMDPQQRILLESSWKAIENAGYDPSKTGGRVGVYASGATSMYLLRNLLPNRQVMESMGDYQVSLSNFNDYFATRISYKLDLRGPSININTACSSSLVTLQMACQGLSGFHCDMALAGAVSMHIPQASGYQYEDGHILSPDGHCRAFDEDAQGTVPGSGVAVVVLKRLEDALADRDSIYAVIRGGAVNNDGAGKVGFTAPSIEGQSAVIAEALAMAGVEPESVSYLEAHGTGTKLGDPMEIAALSRAYRSRLGKRGFCALGSVKTNIGHIDTAAGMAGLIKCVLSLKYRMLPPSLHFRRPNPKIDFATSPFYVNAALRPWESQGPRRAGVSSFGMGGTNTHIILEEHLGKPETHSSRPFHLLPLSAKTSSALDARVADLTAHFKANPDISLADAGFTLACGRRHFPFRKAVACGTLGEALAGLDSRALLGELNLGPDSPSKPQPEPQVVFLFSGQGSQQIRMGMELYRHEPFFRKSLDRCAEILKPLIGHYLPEILYPVPEKAPEMEALLLQTSIAQPALFAFEHSLAQLWMHWGVQPKALIGHSIGEYVAACLAGVFSLENGLRLVAERGRLMQAMPAGAMLFVPLNEIRARELAGDDLELAAANGPGQCVFSGSIEAVKAMENRLSSEGKVCRILQTSHAFHSRHMDPILPEFRSALQTVELSSPKLPFVSNLTGDWITPAQAKDPDYWCAHLRNTVRFRQGMDTLSMLPRPVFIEVGPGQALTHLAKACVGGKSHPVIPSCRKPAESKSDLIVLYSALGSVWELGSDVDWQAFHFGEKRRRLNLPSYRFDGKSYWIHPIAEIPAPFLSPGSPAPAEKLDFKDWFGYQAWTRSPSRRVTGIRAAKEAEKPWLLICEPGALRDGMIRRLRERGQGFITIESGPGYEVRSPSSVVVNPERERDWHAVVDAAGVGSNGFGRVLHLWGMAGRGTGIPGRTETEAIQSRGFFSLLYVCRAIAKRPDFGILRITVAARGIFDVTGEEPLSPEWAPMAGLCKVLPQEFPGMSMCCVDPGGSFRGEVQGQRLADCILEEAEAPDLTPMVAYRGESRWLPFPKRVAFPAHPAGPSLLKENGVYLITGGLGRIGLVLARKIFETAKGKIILVGRTPLPPEMEWESILASADGKDASLISKVEGIRELRRSGAEVMLIQADAGHRVQMQSSVDAAVLRFGRIDGVIHAAGLAKEKLAESIGFQECQEEFQSKIGSLFILEDVFGKQPPDFFLLCSSLASILGGIGFSAYAAANSFMDAFAVARNRDSGAVWISVNWDAWDFQEKATEMGMGSGLKGFLMDPEAGAEAFTRILSERWGGQIIVSTGDLGRRLLQWINPGAASTLALPKGKSARHSRPDLNTPYVAVSTDLEKSIAEVWEELLGVAPIGANDGFFELGGHSLLATRLVSRLRESLRVNFPLRMLFDEPTIYGFAKAVENLRWILDVSHHEQGSSEPMDVGEI